MADPLPQEEGDTRQEEGDTRQEEGEIHALIPEIATASPECSARVRYTVADPPTQYVEDPHQEQEGESCRFFNLPAELHNRIYELAFDGNSEESIALLSAAPPSKAMVLPPSIQRGGRDSSFCLSTVLDDQPFRAQGELQHEIRGDSSGILVQAATAATATGRVGS
ncbi:hypothetical protein LTR02_011320 [Friedmanniomyces endolithicus]|nr:hypothetical protein LTR02_011320 [Friedmanniomyces endolithicus]